MHQILVELQPFPRQQLFPTSQLAQGFQAYQAGSKPGVLGSLKLLQSQELLQLPQLVECVGLALLVESLYRRIIPDPIKLH